ncbi:TPA: hypothetical protein U1Z93_001879 [Streptococcus suis]|nr:hypothetical protein [Streptococcus suis]HEM4643377.1 hypothetical protein [Streptococcus suis]
MKKWIFSFISILIIILPSMSVQAITLGSDNISPYSTSYGNGGVSKIEITGNRNNVWWYVKPSTSHAYTFNGGISVLFTNGTSAYYPITKSGRGGQSVSDIIYLNKKIKRVSLNGIAYGLGGIQITLPNSETNSDAGGGSGMSKPNDTIIAVE